GERPTGAHVVPLEDRRIRQRFLGREEKVRIGAVRARDAERARVAEGDLGGRRVSDRKAVLDRAGLREDETAVTVAVDDEDVVVPARQLRGQRLGRAKDGAVEVMADEGCAANELPRFLVADREVVGSAHARRGYE